jgi:hypothetical protein
MPLELALGLIFLVSAFTMSFAGFGYALVSVPLLALFLPIQEAVALQFPHCMALFMYQAWHYRRHFSWQEMKPLALGAGVGMVAGAWLLYQLPGEVLKRALAVFIAAVVVFNLTPAGRRFAVRHATHRWWGRFCGLVSGAFFGAYTIGGPPAALYITSVTADAKKAKSFLASFFSVQFVLIAVVYAWTGLLSWRGLGFSAAYGPVVALGSVAGFWAFGRASNRVYRRVVDLMLLATALLLWLRP